MRKLLILALICSYSFIYGQEVVTIAGIVETVGSADGPALEATFDNPHGIAMDEVGNVYVVDRFGHKIRKYTQDGFVSTLAGSGIAGRQDGNGTNATFNQPWGICVGKDGNIYVADTQNNLIRKISPEGEVTTFAGSGDFGSANGSSTNATFGNPTGLEMDENGNLYVADHLTHIIRKISPSGNVTTLAGVPNSPGYIDGNGSNSLFYRPYGLTLDINGDILLADEWNHSIRRITPLGVVSTVAGMGEIGHLDGPPGSSKFNFPWDLTVDALGNIYVGDGYNHVIRKLIPSGSLPAIYEVTTYVGNSGVTGAIDGYGTDAEFNAATSLYYWAQTGEIYITDAYNNLIRKIIGSDRGYVGLQMISPQGIPNGGFFCQGMLFEMEASPDTFDTYAFYINGEIAQSGSSVFFSTTSLPTGSVSIMVKAMEGLNTVESNLIDIQIQDFIIEDLVADEIYLFEGNNLVNFNATLNNYTDIEYSWDFGDLASGDENYSALSAPSHLYSGPGTYSVSLIADNGKGCVDILDKENLILFSEGNGNPVIYVPSAFTPNGDGKNDILYVRGEGIEGLEFCVFNQWGQLVFESHTQNEGWDGYFKGKAALNCTYTYLVKATLITGEQEVKSGHVSIIR